MKKKTNTPPVNNYEKERFPCSKEWWCIEGFFNTVKDNKKWSFRAEVYQAMTRSKIIGSLYSVTIFDLTRDKVYKCFSENDSSKLKSAKDRFHVEYDGSYMEGSFPTYHMYFKDLKNNLDLDIACKAKSLPYWVAQEATNGWLPWGIGCFRYGFIPKNEIKGTIKIGNETSSIKGEGYLEHIFGDFSFFHLKAPKVSIRKIISVYAKLFAWWVRNQKIKIPKSIVLSTDNRPIGYDWFWSVLDNGWSLFYGNLVFWLMEGPAAGVLILSKDGKKYTEFGNVHFKYIAMKHIPKYDLYYPTEIEVTSEKGNEKLYLHLKSASKSFEDIADAEEKTPGLVVSQAPCTLEGYYSDGVETISIRGNSKLESHRLLKVFGHNSLRFDFKLSKNCLGVISNFDSHYFGKKIDIDLQFLPRPKLKIKYDRINKP